MIKKISADLIITNTGAPLTNHHIVIDGEKIVGIGEGKKGDGIQYHRGVMTPGFVNAHCHLELSHLKGAINTGTGLIPFIKGVVTLRDYPQEVIDQAIIDADAEMRANGIVAVGDISNQLDTAAVKALSSIRYYSFVEMFDMLQDTQAQTTYEQYKAVYDGQSDDGHNRKSCVPHAPYSVSPSLFELINGANTEPCTVSLHNQELAAENELFLTKSGLFMDFFADLGIDMNDFKATGTSSLAYALSHMDARHRTLLVHNTQSTATDVKAAHAWSDHIYWATCANANLYIENRLPDYRMLIDNGAKVCIGTDSLTSNWSLSVLDEMRTIKRYNSWIDDTEIIKWATLNGANALRYDDLGTISAGAHAGVNIIDVDVSENGEFDLSQAEGVTAL